MSGSSSGTADDESILRGSLDRWKAGVDAHRPEQVSAVFTEDAIFRGTRPYSVGRQGVIDYYAAQPLGLKASYRILEARRPADDVVVGYLDVEFTYTDREPLPVHLGVVLKHVADGWYISYYQVSEPRPEA